jgi:RNA polymerase sigma-70 factor, ECF subfamily
MTATADLASAAKTGDETAFRKLMEHESRWVYGTAVAISGSSIDAEDIFQEAALRAWRDLPRLRRPDLWSAWFHRIVVHVAVELGRKSQRSRRLVVARPPTEQDGSTSTEESDLVTRALVVLSPDERALVALRYGRDLELPEIASMMNIPLGTAKSRLHRTLAKLRVALEGEHEPRGSSPDGDARTRSDRTSA